MTKKQKRRSKDEEQAFIESWPILSLYIRNKNLETCIDCGDPVTKPSPILGRLCKCRDED